MAIATVGHPKLWVATPKARSLLSCNCAIKKEQSLGLGETVGPYPTPPRPAGPEPVTEKCWVQSEARGQLGRLISWD